MFDEPMPPRTRVLSEADQALWAAYARMIAPLHGRSGEARPVDGEAPRGESRPKVPPPSATVQPPHPSPSRVIRPPRSSASPLAVGGQPGGLDKATWQRFRSGKLPVARTLDLHGMTVQHAHTALVAFLRNAHAERLRCVEIVTGRGNAETGGVIRRELPFWLNLPDVRPMVLGAAHPHALNPGSVRLLLRRVR
jgi:DNA-nicking Smr family endonuclease